MTATLRFVEKINQNNFFKAGLHLLQTLYRVHLFWPSFFEQSLQHLSLPLMSPLKFELSCTVIFWSLSIAISVPQFFYSICVNDAFRRNQTKFLYWAKLVDSVTRLQLPADLVIPVNQLSHNLSPL
jgi:hypothetical protein